jgi:hypothetical protein
MMSSRGPATRTVPPDREVGPACSDDPFRGAATWSAASKHRALVAVLTRALGIAQTDVHDTVLRLSGRSIQTSK